LTLGSLAHAPADVNWCVAKSLLWLLRKTCQHAFGALLDGDGVDAVVTPGAIDMQEARRVADLADAELLHDTQGVGVLRSDRDLDRVESWGAEAVVVPQRDRRRHHAAAGDVAVEPVADGGELRGPAHDVVHRHLAGEPAVDLDRERHPEALA